MVACVLDRVKRHVTFAVSQVNAASLECADLSELWPLRLIAIFLS